MEIWAEFVDISLKTYNFHDIVTQYSANSTKEIIRKKVFQMGLAELKGDTMPFAIYLEIKGYPKETTIQQSKGRGSSFRVWPVFSQMPFYPNKVAHCLCFT